MRAEIHPKYQEVKVTCSCGNTFAVGSTLEEALHIDVCDQCHPFYTGQQKLIDTTGRLERFKNRYDASRMAQAKKQATSQKEPAPEKTKKPAAKKPAAKKTGDTKKPAAKKPATKNTADAKKPAAKKPAAKKTGTKKTKTDETAK